MCLTVLSNAEEESMPVPPAITLGGSPTGEVGPFGFQPIEVVYTPYTVEEHKAKFLISFKQSSAAPVSYSAAQCSS